MTKEERNKKIISRAMGLLGAIKSDSKAKASRENGKLGGRPRKLLTINER